MDRKLWSGFEVSEGLETGDLCYEREVAKKAP